VPKSNPLLHLISILIFSRFYRLSQASAGLKLIGQQGLQQGNDEPNHCLI
jgi:hypothetical protein